MKNFIQNHYRQKFKEIFKREYQHVYILDHTCLIDGRVVSFFKHTGFEGRIVVPDFIVELLASMAKSKQFLESSKGKRGSLALAQLNKQLFENGREISVYDFAKTYEPGVSPTEQPEVFERTYMFKILCTGVVGIPIVVTTDAEFAKLLRAHQVCVININELANDLQDMIFIGEKYMVKLTGVGREEGQATGYIKDKVLCVVRDSKKYMGQNVPIVITNMLQTNSGRLLFANLQWE